MAKKISILRVAGPTLLVSLLLFIACTLSAVLLYRLHATTAQELTDDIDSRGIAVEIETTLRNLIAVVSKGGDRVDPLHKIIEDKLEEARGLANTDEEGMLEETLERSFHRYQEIWSNRFDEDGTIHRERAAGALAVLERETLPSAVRLRDYNGGQIQKSEEQVRRTIKWFAWGLAAVGCIGSLAGVIFGYGVARALRHSIYRLSVRIRDAADKLGQDLPTITITESSGIDYLHEQMQGLMREIELMVERLHQREREVLRAEQLAAVGQLAAGVAHELRNPLTAVKMLVATSREDLEARGVEVEDLQIIEQEIQRLERSLQAFLDFARPPKMERRMLDLSPVIEQALQLLSGRARKQEVRVEYEPPEPAVWIEADGEQLRQLLVNLAMNALDVLPKGGIFTIKVVPLQLDRPFVEIHASDTGPGIPKDLLPRLFQPFVSGKETGLGLGLVVSRRIAEEHGGYLWAMNQLQGGACLIVRLPALKPALESHFKLQIAD
jgi:two-component system, NtrC family, sensor histidine kinase HydH